MKRIIFFLISVFSLGVVFGQVTIAQQDFEASPSVPVMTYTGGAIATGNANTPNAPKYVSGSRGLEENNGTSVVLFSAVDASSYSNIEFSVRLASFSGTSGNGHEDSDEVIVEISDDGGTTWSQEIEVEGNFNARWSFTSGTGVASTAFDGDNSATVFAPAGGGNRTVDGYSTIIITDLPNSTNLRVRITLSNNAAGEYWVIDDAKIEGIVASTDTEVELASATYSAAENGTSIQICADITNESATTATTADLVLTSTGTPHLASYTTTGISFPVASSAQQCVTVSIIDNLTCDGNVSYDFELQNVSGGTSATVGSQDTTILSISDNEMVSGTLFSQSFEGSGTWMYSSNKGDVINGYDLGSDEWHSTTAQGAISPTDGLNLWGFQDIDNGTHSGDHILEFTSINTSTYTGVSISFDWATIGFNSTDALGYETNIDGAGWSRTILCTGCGSTSGTVSIPISDASTSVQLRLYGNQDGGSQHGGFDDIKLIGDNCPAPCSEPTSDAVFHANSPQSLTETSATLNFTVGDGDSRIVVLKESSAISFAPVDNATYIANSSFGSGIDVGTGEYVVYNGSLNTVAVTNLTPGTEYYTTIFEYGCTPGLEDYFTSGTQALDTFISIPENPVSFTEGCTGATSLDLSWSAPALGNFDGYLLVVRQGASPHAVTSIDPSIQTFDLDYTSAPTYGAGAGSSVLYNGTATSASITGLTNGLNYTFEVLAYTIGTSAYKYSTGTTLSQTIDLLEVSGEVATGSDMEIEIVWANPSALCYDEILIVANETAGIGFAPTGNGSSYIANTVYSAANQVVYKGTGVTETITALTNGTTYYFEIFVRKGTDWSPGIEVSAEPSTATIFESGDMAIVSFNSSNSSSEDEFCFIAFKDIAIGTTIDFTDNGYGRVNAGQWGDTEGVIRITKNSGATITAGTVICIQGNGVNDSDFEIYNCGVLDDANWSVTSLNSSLYPFNFNSSDQIWIMQGGSWSNPSGSHNATYTGNLTYGFTATGWITNPNFSSTSGSQLYEGSECYNTDVDGLTNSDKVKYTGPMTVANQRTWISRINNSANWTDYSSNANYNAGGSDYIGSCITFSIDNSSGFSTGVWEGDDDSNWFNCANWQTLRVPDETVDVIIETTAGNEANFDNTNTNASIYGSVAKCKNLTIEDGIWLEASSNLDTIKVFGNLVIEDDGLLDLNGATTGAVLELGGDFTNNDPNDDSFDDDKSLVVLNGSGQQEITTAHSSNKEDFYNLTLSKAVQTKANLNDDIEVKNILSFESGFVKTNTNKVYVSNGATSSILGYDVPNSTGVYSNDRYIEGNLEREITSASSYEFPVGADPSTLGYNPIVLTVQSGTGSATGKFVVGSPGTITASDASQTCSGSPVFIDYSTMTGLGSWNFTSATSYSYDVMLHPNALNMNTSPNSDGQYRALKAPAGAAGGIWPPSSATGGDFCTVSSNYFAIPGNGYTGFSDFGVGGGTSGPALPVELLYFSVEEEGEKVALNWATVTEINNDFFTLERSKDGKNFESIGEVKGAGNYTGKLDYNFFDQKPLSEISYYRLKQTDFDNTFEYSDIKVLTRKSETIEIGNLYPNPVSNELIIPISSFDFEIVVVSIVDVAGRKIFEKEVQINAEYSQLNLNVNNLISGIYIISFKSKRIHKNLQFVKE